MVKCESLRINMFQITHTGKSVNFPVTIPTKNLEKFFYIFWLSWSLILYGEPKNLGLFGQVTN